MTIVEVLSDSHRLESALNEGNCRLRETPLANLPGTVLVAQDGGTYRFQCWLKKMDTAIQERRKEIARRKKAIARMAENVARRRERLTDWPSPEAN